jgi:2-iminobutanoate/2-iminopropanoate deaminase
MSRIAAIASAVLIFSSSVAAAPPQYFPAPARQGAPAPFSTAAQVGDVLFMSGQIGVGPDGKLPDTFDGQARQVMENVGGVLKAHGLGWGDVFKCTVMIADMKNWPAFNSIYVPYFPAGKLPARSAFGANGLALGAQLELECMAYAGKK